ncbi:MAG: SulP family inorganic anion transporter [Synergistaceae bacterium]|jgi:SulP family sulfate permease|nr:SulP family inorganic anion transporter [Synergistaceae bacterium]
MTAGYLIKNYVRDIKREFAGYSAANFRQDALAGATVAAVALPLALAFGVGSGADAAAGLISAIVSAFVIGTLSGASFQISGPTGAMTAILIPLSIKFGISGVLAAGFISGILLTAAGLCKAGRLVNLIPVSVITGFTSGIAIIIALGQLESFLGVSSQGSGTLIRVWNIFARGFNPNPYAVATGLAVIGLILLWPARWASVIPGSLVSIVLAAELSSALDLPLATVGQIPVKLIHDAHLSFETFHLAFSEPMLLAGTSIAALGMVESLLCGVAGGRMKGEKLDVDRELVAQGIGNMLLPFLGGVPATAAIARSSVAIRSGGRTRMTGAVQGAILLLSMFLLAPFMSKIPLAALAGVLMVTAWRMNEWHTIRYIFARKFRMAELKFLITLSATVFFDLTVAIAAGVFFAIAVFVFNVANLVITVHEADSRLFPAGSGDKEHARIVSVTGPMFFAAMERFETAVHQIKADILVFSMGGVPYIDASGAHQLRNFCKARKDRGETILFASLHPGVKEFLDQAGIVEIVGRDAFFDSVPAALGSVGKKTELSSD